MPRMHSTRATALDLEPGVRLGTYEVGVRIGAGGMGEVYRAVDTRLQRTVAIKAISNVTGDGPKPQRAHQEARTLSALNHPNICSIYDVLERDGNTFIVMEFVEGETLAARLGRKSIPVIEAITYAAQIAEALHHAHRRGVVHLDLKPSNIMLTESGVKLLDFGVAALLPPPQLRETDTLTDALAIEGLTQGGTLAYMAPEQLEGRRLDARTDVFAFGAVIYEMLTGRRAFAGDSPAALIAAVLEHEPPPLASEDLSLRDMDHVVAKCMAKDPERRWQSARDVADELKWLADRRQQATSVDAPVAPTPRRAWWYLGALAGAAVAFAAGATFIGLRTDRGDVTRWPVRATIELPGMTLPSLTDAIALAPDGRHVAIVAAAKGGPNLLWVRPLHSLSPQPVAGTEGASQPFWSADSESVAFFSAGKLRTVNIVRGGVARVICDASPGFAGTWSRNNDIIFQSNLWGGLVRVSALGGAPQPLTTVDTAAGELGHRWPQFLPDNNTFIYFVRSGNPDRQGVYIAAFDSPEGRLLIHGTSNAAYARPGYLLFSHQAALMAQSFDFRSRRLSGAPVRILPHVARSPLSGRSAFAVSGNALVYLTESETELVWVDRYGRDLGRVTGSAVQTSIALSPDGHRVAVTRIEGDGNEHIWVMPLAGGVAQRLTADPSTNRMPVWSPDGHRIVFASNRQRDLFGLYEQQADGSRSERVLLQPTLTTAATDWSRDGSLILYDHNSPSTMRDVWALPLDRTKAPFAVVANSANDVDGRFCPSGRCVAYASDASGQFEIYVREFPSDNTPVRISVDGGIEPRWTKDGRQLFFIDRAGVLMTADFDGAGSLIGAAPRPLFRTRMLGSRDFAEGRTQYEISRDGTRILMNVPVRPSSAVFVLNDWLATLRNGLTLN